MHPFLTPWKHQKTLLFSDGRERVHWERTGQDIIYCAEQLTISNIYKHNFLNVSRNHKANVTTLKSSACCYLRKRLFRGRRLQNSWKPSTLLKKKLQYRCFPVQVFREIFKSTFLQNTSGWLLLGFRVSELPSFLPAKSISQQSNVEATL